MRRISAGEGTAEIALALALSPKTVSTYRSRILEKLNLRTTAQLIRYGIEHGI
jgi:DNA-binding CsgD family transcriptional regulator